MEEVLREEQVTIGKLDQRTRELLEEAREAHTATNAHVEASTKVWRTSPDVRLLFPSGSRSYRGEKRTSPASLSMNTAS
jgi:hypothetical protein